MNMRLNAHRSLLIGLMIPLCLATDTTRADVTYAVYYDSGNYAYWIKHMPDLDQGRESGGGAFGLPGNGAQYCVPTSSTNMCAYAANHGFPDINPGPGLWQLQSNYTVAGLNILNMGSFMGTSATSGTTGAGWLNGLTDWLAWNGKFTATHYYNSGSYTPRLYKMAKIGIDGSLVSLAYGRYPIDGFYLGSPQLGARTSGHIVTLAHAVALGPDNLLMGVRDPGDNPDSGDPNYLKSQSPFGNRYYDVEDLIVYTCAVPLCIRIMTSLNYDPANPAVALLDEYMAIKPKQGYSFTPGGGLFKITALYPFKLLGSGKPDAQEFVLAAGTPILDAVIHPDLDAYLVLRDGDSRAGVDPLIQLVDAVTGDSTDLADAPGATKLAMGRKRNLYVLADDELRCVDFEDPTVPVVASVVMPGTGDAVAYDDATDEVVVLSIDERAIIRYPDGFPVGSGPAITAIPAEIPMAGNASLAIHPPDPCDPDPCPTDPWFVTDASADVFGMTTTPLTRAAAYDQISLPELTSPTCIDFDDAGHMFVSNEGGVVELADNGLREWELVPADESFFGGAVVEPMFHVTRSRSNYDPALHSGPGWAHIDPDSGELETGTFLEDCDADFNDDRVVNVPDLLQLLNDWGACDLCVADTNGDRSVNVPDLLALLNGWGPCP